MSSPVDVTAAARRLLAERESIRVGDLAAQAAVSRQTAHAHLTRLVHSGAAVRTGAGRGTRYAAPPAFSLTADPRGLSEDAVWHAMEADLAELQDATRAARDIAAYAVTELVNNAVDHADADWVTITADARGGSLTATVLDDGIGAFARVQDGLGLDNPYEAVEALSKGKTTTDPDRHTGEGIFFTSRAVDVFVLDANGLRWTVDNLRGEHALGPGTQASGSRAAVEVRADTTRDLPSLFARFSDPDTGVFDGSHVVVQLYTHGVRFVSRSEAKRLLRGLDRFRRVTVDFAGVEQVGQGFVDEIFRVWARAHPETDLQPVHMIEPVAFMVRRGLPHPR